MFKELFFLGKFGFVEKIEKNISQTLIFILKVIILLVLLKVFCLGLLKILDVLGILDAPHRVDFKNYKLNTLLQYVYFAVYIPIIEELVFRAGLRVSKLNLVLITVSLPLLVLKGFLNIEWTFSIVASLVLLAALFFLLRKERVFETIDKFCLKNRRTIFYILLFSFGFLHLNGHDITIKLLLFSPVVVLPHITGGFMLSYVRLKLGIIYAILLHSLNNTIPFVIMYFVR